MKTSQFNLYLTIALTLGTASPAFVQAGADDHDHNHEQEAHATENTPHNESDEGENTSRISNDMAKKVGIGTTLASDQVLHQTITSYGVLSTGPEQLSHMRARFSGLITSVSASIGDAVKAGDLLAKIESDESLKQYSVRAPISGTIVQRHANTGNPGE